MKRLYSFITVFILLIGVIITLGFTFKINTYEINTIVKISSNIDKVVLSNHTYDRLKNSVDKNIFYYTEENTEKKQKIIKKNYTNGYVELYLQNMDENRVSPLISIKYFVEKNPYWKEIFK